MKPVGVRFRTHHGSHRCDDRVCALPIFPSLAAPPILRESNPYDPPTEETSPLFNPFPSSPFPIFFSFPPPPPCFCPRATLCPFFSASSLPSPCCSNLARNFSPFNSSCLTPSNLSNSGARPCAAQGLKSLLACPFLHKRHYRNLCCQF